MTDLFKRSWLSLLLGSVAVGVGAWYWMGPSATPEPALEPMASQASGVRAAGSSRVSAASGAGSQSGPVTVSDATGATLNAARLFELGFAGGLVIDRDTRASIESLLNTLPEDLSEADLARLERTLREGLPKEDAEKAMKLFRDYRSYTEEVRTEMTPKGIPTSLEEARAFFDQMEAVKRRHFDEATASALFGPDDSYARATMEAMFVQQSTTLTPEQKKAQLDALRAKLPPDQKSLIPEPTAEGASQPAS
jgi:lipase chaperone LimK